MRIEDVGSLSPSGDLLAFGIALALTVGLMGVLIIDDDRGSDDLPFSNWFDILKKSDLLDPDDDGLMGPFVGNITDTGRTIPVIEQDIYVELRSNDIDLTFILKDGTCFNGDLDYVIDSPIHSTLVLFEGPFPGSISIGVVQVIT